MLTKTYLTMVCLCLAAWTSLDAQTQYIGPDNGDWFTAANWNNGLPANGNDPLIGGGINVVIGSPLTVDFTITNFGGIIAGAAITNDGSIGNSGSFTVSATGSFTNNGTFNNFGTTDLLGTATFVNEAGASFTNTGTFTMATTLVNRGAIANNGTINAANGTLQTEGTFDNNQVLTTEKLTVAAGANFTNNFGSVLTITGAAAELLVDGNFNNLGTVDAAGTFTINGTFSNSVALNVTGTLSITSGGQLNNSGGTVTNTGSIQNSGTFINGFQLLNSGTFDNFAQFNNNNLIDNQAGASFQNHLAATLSMGFGSKIQNTGTFINDNALNSFGTIQNDGTFTNDGTINSFSGSLIDNNNNFTNNGTISTNDQVLNDLDFTNNGTINVNGGSVWLNNSNFTNGLTGTVNVVQDFQNKAGGTLTNNGRFTNNVRTLNEGSFTNNAFFDNEGDLTNAAGATFTNNELLLQQAGNIKNEGTLANADHLLSDECSSINNTGTINNTGNLEVHAILFQRGTMSGTALNCQGCYVHTGATSDAPSVCQNGTFGADINGDVKVYAPELIAFANFDSCANMVYLANGIDRPVFACSDIGTTITGHVVLRTRLNDSLTCTAIITPVDVLEPQFDQCPGDIVVFTPDATATATWTPPVFTDVCTAATVTQSHLPGDSFPVGITGVTYTGTDDYGNVNNCQFRVDVRSVPPGGNCTGDATAPVFADCPANITLLTSGTSATATWLPPTPSDNCFPLSLKSNFAPGQSFGVGTTTVVYTATDGNGNEGSCSFDVTVNFDDPCLTDATPPAFSGCPANIYQPTNPAINGAVAIWTAPGVFDLCGIASSTASHASGSIFPEGTTIVTYTAEDVNANVSTCNFTVTVGADPCPGTVPPPVFSNCPADLIILTTGSSATANWIEPTASSPCGPLTINSNYSPGATFQLGNTLVVYTASDLKGNTATCSFNVLVQNDCDTDNVPPVISNCPADISVASMGGSGIATWVAPSANDNCGLTSFAASYAPGSSFPLGVTTVIYTAVDLQGNVATCEFNVSVVDAPGCTTNASPIDGTTDVDPASVGLSWNSVLTADSYDVYLGTANPPTTLVAAGVAGTSTTVIGLQGGTVYYWYAVPANVAGSASGCEGNATQFSTAGGGTGGGCNLNALFIASSTSLNSSDADAKARLEALGFTVTVKDDNQTATSDADGMGLIVISSTTYSVNVNTKFRDVAVPVICWESWLFDDFKMTGTGSGNNYGNVGSSSQLSIDDASHPIAAGLSGTFDVLTSNNSMAWGRPSANAASIATLPWDSSRKFIFAYETGDNMVGMNAPARRVGFFLHNSTAHKMTAEGQALFDEAVKWAAGLQTPGTACNDGDPNTTNDVILADGCTCQGTPPVEICGNGLDDDGDGLIDCQDPDCGATTMIVSSRVNADEDDAEERLSNGDMDLTSSDLELISEGSKPQIVGMRFNDLNIPQGAYITNAYIEFETDETDSGQTDLTFSGQASDDAQAFDWTDYNISDRPQTAASVDWDDVPAWNTVSEKHQTPDLSPVVQEIVDRGGWMPGNSLVILVEGSGERTAESYDGESANAPLLVVEYSDCAPCDDLTDAGQIGATCQGDEIFLENLASPSGGSGNIEYLWISGTTDCDAANMDMVPGGNSAELLVGNVAQTTYFIRCSRRAGCTDWNNESNCVTVEPNECDAPATQLQVGEISIEQAHSDAWYQVDFETAFDVAPIVVLGPPSANGGQPVMPRIRSISNTGFEFQLDEWDYLDGYHTFETLYFVAMTPGTHDMGGVTVEAGSMTANSSWATQSFDQPFGSTPIILSTVVTNNDNSAVTTRIRNVNNSSFQLLLQEEDAETHADETVHYLAMTQGSFTHEGRNFKAGLTPNAVKHKWYTIDFDGWFDSPGFLADFHTHDGGDVSAIRYRDLYDTEVEVKVEEEQFFDSETNHTTEAFGWLVFDNVPAVSNYCTACLFANTDASLNLQLEKGDEFAILYWTHNRGKDVESYQLERSTDGTRFEMISETESKGGTSIELYEGYDLAPQIGDNYYRIKLLHNDGTVSYSEIINAHFADLIDFVLFPNPANDFVKINLEQIVGMEDVRISIFNNLGIMVDEIKIDKVYSKYYQMDIRALKEGHYIIWLNVAGRKPIAKQLVVGKI